MKKLHWQQIASTEITEIFCSDDYDGVVLDTEHGNFTEEQMFTLISLINAHGKESYVRFSMLDKPKVRKALDAGVYGLIFSTIQSQLQIDKIVRWCKYPPIGRRGQGLVGENLWGRKPEKIQNRDPKIIAQIENVEGMDILKILVDIKHNIDYFLIGPYDLSASLGCCGDFDNPIYQKEINRFNELVPDEKKAIHLVTSVSDIKFCSHYGLVALGMDTLSIINDTNNINTEIKKYDIE